MSGLSLNVGLFSGIDYVSLVDKLISIDAISKDNLAERNKRLEMESDALTAMLGRFYTTSFMIKNLNRLQPYLRTDVSSSNPSLVTIAKTGTPIVGSYTFTPLQMASSQQTIAKGVASDTDALGKTGTITIGKGWSVENDNSVMLSDLNGGNGVSKGSIRIVDGNGIRTTIDLRKAVTIKDVINAINDNDNVDVIAELDGDHIVLRDVSGGDPSRMAVQEVSGGSTAASLGLIGHTTSASGVLTGGAIWRLGENTSLNLLNDGNGLIFENYMPDLTVYCRDGSTVNIDFNRLTTSAEQAAGAPTSIKELTVGDLLNTINNSTTSAGITGKISARISDDGKGIVLQDNTQGNLITFIAQNSENPILQKLGFTISDVNYQTIFTGLEGTGTHASMQIQDKAGNTAVIELTDEDMRMVRSGGMSTLAGRLNNAIQRSNELNGTHVAMEFKVNSNNTGLSVVDTSGGSGSLTVSDYGVSNLASRLGLTGTTEGTDLAVLVGAVPGKIRFTNQNGVSVQIELTSGDLAGLTNVTDAATLLTGKISAAEALAGVTLGITVGVNGNALAIEDTTGGTTCPMRIADVTGNTAFRLGLTVPTTSVDMSTALTGVTPGTIEFTNAVGSSVSLTFTQPELDGLTSLADLANLFRDKFDAQFWNVGVNINGAGNGLVFTNTANGSGTLTVADLSGDLAARLGIAGTGERYLNTNVGHATPGELRFTDKAGNTAVIDITQAEIDALSDPDTLTTLENIRDLFNTKLSGSGVDLVFAVDSTGRALTLTDTSGGPGANELSIESVDPDKRFTNLATYVGLHGSSMSMSVTGSRLVEDVMTGNSLANGTAESHAIESQPVIHGDAFNTGKIETRNLIGGLDTVLVSTLNGGNGLAKAKPGTITVQDRAGHTADITLTQADLNSMQTLSDAVKLYNQKLSNAGIGITVKVNDQKTGLQLVDTTGSTAFNLVFKDKPTGMIVPGSPEVLGVDAISGVSSTTRAAISNGYGRTVAGTASLNFGNTSLLNGYTFGFTYNAGEAGYNATTKKFTVYLDETALVLEPSSTARDSMVKSAIDAQIAADWSTIYPSATYGTLTPPTVTASTGLATRARNDAISGGETTVGYNGQGGSTGISAAGTAILTFEETGALNGMGFQFTTNPLAAGYSAGNGQTWTFYLGPEVFNETNPATQDALVKARIDATLADSRWAYAFNGAAVPTVKLTAGMGAQAVADALTGGMTGIGSAIPTSQNGVTHVPAVPDTTIQVASSLASAFGLNVDTATSTANGSNLNKQIISFNTPLSELNAGAGVTTTGGKFIIQDSTGKSAVITIDAKKHQTVGDILNEINRAGVLVKAGINETGDGIVLTDIGGGTKTFSCADADSTSKFAASLGIAQSIPQSKKDPDGRLRISAPQTYRIEVEAKDSLDDIRKKINDLNAGYSATILVDGSSTPYRLSISSKNTGTAGAFNVDLSAIGLTTETVSEAKDAKITYGDANMANALVLKSSTNTFKNVINGADLTITGVSDSPVTITCASSATDVLVSLRSFVENYNTFREQLNNDMYFEVSTKKGIQANSILWNSPIARAFDREVTNMLQKTVTGIPGIRSLADLGITMSSNAYDAATNSYDPTMTKVTGKLYFDEEKFMKVWERDSEGVQKFFFNEMETTDKSGNKVTVKTGWAQKFTDMADNLIGSNDGSIPGKVQARLDVLDQSMTRNEERIAFMEERLEFKRQMYLKQFYAMEQALAKMSSQSSSVANIMTSWSSNYSSGSGGGY